MKGTAIRATTRLTALATVLLLAGAVRAGAAIDGVTGTTFVLTAKDDYISTPDGNSIYMWGYALGDGTMQHPGPTLIVSQGALVTVTLTNRLPVPASIVFPEQEAVTAVGGTPGKLTREALPGQTVTYQFTAWRPGTFLYQSGTNPELQLEMGLAGALVVRPAVNPATQAYNHPDTTFEHEYLFFLSEIDPVIHELAEERLFDRIDLTAWWPVYWLINGRCAPDTMADAHVDWLPTQPYNSMPQTHPGERVLLRMVGAGRDLHPLHTHGAHHRVVARNGYQLGSTSLAGPDGAEDAFTSTVAPGQTADALWVWTGEGLGWDVYGHAGPAGEIGQDCVDAGVPMETGEDPADHCKPIPVVLPSQQELTFGAWYSGSPYLGAAVPLPPGEGGLNPNFGYFFMWHSHNEKEITNFDIFPGGMLTMMVVEHPSVMLMNP